MVEKARKLLESEKVERPEVARAEKYSHLKKRRKLEKRGKMA
jgi:hypothetical protein